MRLAMPITPSFWFDSQAEEAARFYVGIFEDSRIVHISYYGEAGHEIHKRPAGSVLEVLFELNGQPFTALNGGPLFKFNEAVSLQVMCETQDEIDFYWERLGAGGDPRSQQCGWLKDRYGVSWQVLPHSLITMMGVPGSAASDRMMVALLGMKKLDIAALQRAWDGA
jgi:predicted 3-demethylubiquinone-9 3-methyltransferase (glyoxalase superfamily)